MKIIPLLLLLSATSRDGKTITLDLPADPVTTEVHEAVVCSTPAHPLKSALLWMPHHGHGSSPTRLTAQPDGCTKVADMDFSMDGAWEVRVTFTDGDRGTFALDVVYP